MATTKDTNEAIEQKPQKSQRLILQHTEEAALTQLKRTPLGLVLSGFSAGLDIGFSILLMIVIQSMFTGIFPAPVVKFMVANAYPVGFIFVVLGRSELFTEHTTLAVLPVLQKLAPMSKLFRLWGMVYASNIIGGVLFALILYYLSGNIHVLDPQVIGHMSRVAADRPWLTLGVGGAMAGWLMGLLAWLVSAARETISQLFVIWIITVSISLAGFPHCIAGNIEVSSGLFTGTVTMAGYLKFLSAASIGNAIGGALFVGVLKFSHTTFSGKEENIELGD